VPSDATKGSSYWSTGVIEKTASRSRCSARGRRCRQVRLCWRPSTAPTIVPFSINRLPNGTFRAAADDPIHVPSDSPADLAVATQRIAAALEGHIAPAPEQWYNFKPIWPATAEEAAKLEARNRAAMANDAKGAAPNGTAAPNGGETPKRPEK